MKKPKLISIIILIIIAVVSLPLMIPLFLNIGVYWAIISYAMVPVAVVGAIVAYFAGLNLARFDHDRIVRGKIMLTILRVALIQLACVGGAVLIGTSIMGGPFRICPIYNCVTVYYSTILSLFFAVTTAMFLPAYIAVIIHCILARRKNCGEKMKRLFTIDLKDYGPNAKKFYRPSVRGIIFNKDGNIAMVYSKKFHYYKFPGGGIEDGETHLQTLKREIKEEAGMTLIPESVKAFGEVLKIQGNHESDDEVVFIQQNFYYTCEVKDEIGEQDLDDDEADAEYDLQFVPLEEAIRVNAAFESDNPLKKQMVERERRVLEIIKKSR